MRYDYFIIWGNGINHIPAIVDMITRHSNFKIIFESLIQTKDQKTLIQGIYESDTVPWSHLVAKSKYLINAEKKIYFILTENKEPDSKSVGRGAFRHEQCQKVTQLKTEIRNTFNPKNKEINTAPLNPGVSHEHVIHSSDYPSQVEHVLDFLELPDLKHFKEFSNKIDITYFLLDMPEYVILRMSKHFPSYYFGSDLDILCEDVDSVLIHILEKRGDLEFRVTRFREHTHIDYMVDGKIDFRFDLIQKLHGLEKVVLENKIKPSNVFIPTLPYDLAVRYLEYHLNPKKVHHLEYCKPFPIDYKAILKKHVSSYK
jgi:hypothetical protein